jgi:hypothetical protein
MMYSRLRKPDLKNIAKQAEIKICIGAYLNKRGFSPCKLRETFRTRIGIYRTTIIPSETIRLNLVHKTVKPHNSGSPQLYRLLTLNNKRRQWSKDQPLWNLNKFISHFKISKYTSNSLLLSLMCKFTCLSDCSNLRSGALNNLMLRHLNQ